ncbi:fibropellin-1-like isoform X2 [Actinia tenebrosa]|uniref:Fibropellin-1-like isoform X2 n=1 Tax=Actinia tenebrosa TaxID=6105 RepID=A0A6P8IT08_ACTTE|nr:fibropellin-1-like isoform X2 [Actinia tenebrosa]
MGRVLTLCLILATVSCSSSTNLAKLSSTIHKIGDVLKRLKNEPTTTKDGHVLKKPIGATLDDTLEGSGNIPGKLTKEERNVNNKIKNKFSGNKKLQSRHKKDHGIPQAMKPLQVVATSAVIRNRLNKQPRVSPKPVKAIHVWGQTPFNTVVSNIMKMNERLREEQQQKRLIQQFQDNRLQEFSPVQTPEIKTPQLPISDFQLPMKEPTLQGKLPQVIQINEHEGDSKNVETPVDEGADARGVLQRPIILGDQINHEAPQTLAQPNEPQEDFYNHYVQQYNPHEREEQEQAQERAQEQVPEIQEQEPLRNHYRRHHFHHHSTVKTKPKCDPNPCLNDGVCTAFLHDYECTCPIGFMGRHCEDINQCLPNPCKNNGNCYPTKTGFQCTCVHGYKGENCEAISKCIPNPCKNNGVCQEPIRSSQDYLCICSPGYKGSNCQEKDYCGTHNPCRNGGSCINGESSRLCRCRDGYTGPDCGDIDVCHSSPCSNGGTCISSGAGMFKCQCSYMYSGYTCEEKSSRCAALPCQNGGTCIELDNNNGGFRCECSSHYSGVLCQNTRNPCEQNPCGHNGRCLASGDSYVCVCEPGFSGTTCEVHLTTMCQGCDMNAKCIAGKCVCLPGFNGNGNVCEVLYSHGSNETQHESVPSKCHPNPCYNGGICKETEKSFTCECVDNFVGLTCQETLPCNSQPCQHGGMCVDDRKSGTYTCQCEKGYKGKNCEEPTACEPNPCENGATCTPRGNSYVCKCTKRFQGPKCEEDKCSLCDVHAHCEDGKCVCDNGYSGEGTKDECFRDGASNPRFCLPNPCKNGGSCQELPNGHSCICYEGFSGDNCELGLGAAPPKPKPDPCASNPCHHDGTCINEGNTFRCNCTAAYQGKTCQEEAPHFCHPNPCLHGGTCQETGSGYTCKCPGAYRGQNCDVDDCDQCDIHAICIHGACRCRIGYKGDGLQCEKIKRCHQCHKYASCVANECICNPGYTGNGQICSVPPATAEIPPCPANCEANCLSSCPQHCCKVTVHPITVQTTDTCPQHCSATCAPTCPPKCCSKPYLPSAAQTVECPTDCNSDHCAPSCPSQCCSHNTCPSVCHEKCQPFCPIRCCSPDEIPPPINPTALAPLMDIDEGGTAAPVVTSCPAQCKSGCQASCPAQCCEMDTTLGNAVSRSLLKTKPKSGSSSKHTTVKKKTSSVKASQSVASVSELSPERKEKLIHTLSALLSSPLGKCPEECETDCSYLCPAPCCKIKSKKKTIIEINTNDEGQKNAKNMPDQPDFDLELDR